MPALRAERWDKAIGILPMIDGAHLALAGQGQDQPLTRIDQVGVLPDRLDILAVQGLDVFVQALRVLS